MRESWLPLSVESLNTVKTGALAICPHQQNKLPCPQRRTWIPARTHQTYSNTITTLLAQVGNLYQRTNLQERPHRVSGKAVEGSP